MEYDNYETVSSINSDIDGFLQDQGLVPGTYEYEASTKGSKYSAEVRLLGEDADEVATEIVDSLYELQEHLRITYPEFTVNVVLTTDAFEYHVDGQTELSDGYETDDQDFGMAEDGEEDDYDDDEQQYIEEGMHIISEEDEDSDFLDELLDAEDAEDDDDLSEDDEYEQEEDAADEIPDADYVPTAEDREELWKAFGGFEDE